MGARDLVINVIFIISATVGPCYMTCMGSYQINQVTIVCKKIIYGKLPKFVIALVICSTN